MSKGTLCVRRIFWTLLWICSQYDGLGSLACSLGRPNKGNKFELETFGKIETKIVTERAYMTKCSPKTARTNWNISIATDIFQLSFPSLKRHFVLNRKSLIQFLTGVKKKNKIKVRPWIILFREKTKCCRFEASHHADNFTFVH